MQTPSAESDLPTIEVEPVFTWTVFRLSSEMRRDAIIQAINNHFSRMETADVIWDLSKALLAALHDGDLEAILSAAKAHGAKRKDARTVFVCSNPAVVAAVSAYMGLAEKEEMTVDYAAFDSLEEAERWLTCNRQHRCGSGEHEPGYAACPRGACRSMRLFQAYRRFGQKKV